MTTRGTDGPEDDVVTVVDLQSLHGNSSQMEPKGASYLRALGGQTGEISRLRVEERIDLRVKKQGQKRARDCSRRARFRAPAHGNSALHR